MRCSVTDALHCYSKGIHAMMDPSHVSHNVEASLAVLLACGLVDGYSLYMAHQFLQQSAKKEKMRLWQYMQSGR